MSKRANGEGSWKTRTVKGSEYWEYKAYIDGTRRSFYGKTKREALDKYNKYINSAMVETDTQSITFYQYCYDWLWKYKKKSIKPTTFDYYEFIIDSFIKDTTLGDITLKKLNALNLKQGKSLFQKHIENYCNKSRSTVSGLYTVLNQVNKYGLTYQDFGKNFMEGVEKPSEKDVSVKKKDIKALDYDDVMKLWKEMLRKNTKDNIVNGKAGTYVYGIGAYALLFCAFTGLRWGEVSRLQWNDINKEGTHYYFKVDKQFVVVKNRGNNGGNHYKSITETPKSEKSNRYIPLSKKALSLLRMVKSRFPECHQPDHLIFSTTNNPYSSGSINRLLKAMCVRAGVTPVSPHALRHSFASILLNEDEKNLYVVSDILGHSSSDVTYKRYIDIFEKNKAMALSLFDNMDE